MTQTDVVVVGLGPGGEATANRLAREGLDVIGVEKGLVGGECPFWGCVPSKVMSRAAYSLVEARRVNELAGTATVEPSWAPVAERIRTVATHDWDDSHKVAALERRGARVVRGHGTVTGPRTVEVDGQVLEARRAVVVGPGAVPSIPPIPGLEGTPYWTNRHVMEVTELPGSLAIIGAGTIGAELAQVFARFGVRVTMLEAADRILANEEPEVSPLVAEVFAREGIRVMPQVEIAGISYDDGTFTIDLGEEQVTADKLLVATGRVPVTDEMGLENVGVDTDVRFLPTDGRMRVEVDGAPLDWLYAVGDVVGKGAFSHTALYQSYVAVQHILGEDGPEADFRAIPRVTFTDPEVGSVGLTEAQAREEGRDVRTGFAGLDRVARGNLHQVGNEGFVKVVVEGDLLVGATSVGPMGGEVLSMLSTAVHARVPVPTLKSMIYAYPTFHEAVRKALADLG